MSVLELSLGRIQDFIVREVATSPDFAAYATTIIGQGLNFYKGSDLSHDDEVLPYFVAHKFNSDEKDNEDSSGILQFIIAIEEDEEAIVDSDGITVFQATDNVEKLAIKAVQVIKAGLRSGSLDGRCDLRISGINILPTEVGEADDVQVIVTLHIEAYRLL